MLYEEITQKIAKIKNLKTKDIDLIANDLYKRDVDVGPLLSHIKESGALHRIYFVVSLKRSETFESQLSFIEQHWQYFSDWWHTDILLQLLKKVPSFDYVYAKAKEYVESPLLYVRRWGYVIFLNGLQKDPKNTRAILKLMHDDDEHHVQMAEAWLIADLCIYAPEIVLDFIAQKNLGYNIIGKAIQKICDSFRISEDIKSQAKSLRALYK
ncbi:MAG: DNA alkylation repair protein [Bacilli bacterium]|jgi:3-methyladenine DNA glycosylase AlkD